MSRWLPRGLPDLLRQLLLFLGCYLVYELVRGAVGAGGPRPFADATRIIDLERRLHVFAEPAIQSWVERHAHWLLDLADLVYLNAHLFVTVGALAFIYARRPQSFAAVRNTFLIAMALALVGYAVFPTAPPRLMPRWGFSDPVHQLTGVSAEHGAAGTLINPYAAVPSMHICFALMVALPMSRLVGHRAARFAWLAYPVLIAAVVVVTGNHYFVDIALGAVVALLATLLSERLLARTRPTDWAFSEAPA